MPEKAEPWTTSLKRDAAFFWRALWLTAYQRWWRWSLAVIALVTLVTIGVVVYAIYLVIAARMG